MNSFGAQSQNFLLSRFPRPDDLLPYFQFLLNWRFSFGSQIPADSKTKARFPFFLSGGAAKVGTSLSLAKLFSLFF
jgi:hypothetical protein